MLSIRRAYGRVLCSVLLMIVLWSSSGPTGLRAQEGPFDIDVVSVRGDEAGQTRLDLYTQVPHDLLQFISNGKSFTARYELTASVYNVNGRGRKSGLVLTQSWQRELSVPNFGQTQSDKLYDQGVRPFSLKPGRYLVEVRIEDLNTRNSYSHAVPTNVRDMSRPVAISDLILLKDYDAEKNVISPDVGGTARTDQKVLRYFHEVYTSQPTDIRLVREVVRVQGKRAPSFWESLEGKSDDEGLVTAYSRIDAQPVKEGRTQMVVEVPMSTMPAGNYIVRVLLQDSAGKTLDTTEEPVRVAWAGLDHHIRDLDQAIAQLAYIAKDREVREIRRAPTDAERISRFRAFWAKRDPTPGTSRNERMEEYYYRVDAANRKFGSLTPGWKTDRGHVSILYGQPDFIERHPFNQNQKPYEVWFYYRIGRQFVFIDKTGFGDFEIMIPVWDERTRIR